MKRIFLCNWFFIAKCIGHYVLDFVLANVLLAACCFCFLFSFPFSKISPKKVGPLYLLAPLLITSGSELTLFTFPLLITFPHYITIAFECLDFGACMQPPFDGDSLRFAQGHRERLGSILSRWMFGWQGRCRAASSGGCHARCSGRPRLRGPTCRIENRGKCCMYWPSWFDLDPGGWRFEAM